ncbi:MAG: glycosyltransferase, partial [Candidatus Omnitrophica bacterium]|nr:glycosyltransferase [Candidatus Omnitrophota bacterium]
IVNRLYMGVIKRTPKIWDYLYDNPRVLKKLENIKDRIHKFNSPKLKKLFDRFNPDVVACAQAFPCGMVADYKKAYQSNLPLVAVLTDYIPHAYWIYDSVDYYIAPSDEVKARLTERGVSEKKIKTFGIPFDHTFNETAGRMEIAKNLRLDAGTFTILIMGGGQGLGPIKSVVRSLEKLKIGLQEIIVTSDVIITKPGGITTAEALSKNLPMIIIKPIPGQEMNNTLYLTKKQAALKIDRPQDTACLIAELASSPEKFKEMRQAAQDIAKPRASLDIAELLLSAGNV